jgi:hypothetical protein
MNKSHGEHYLALSHLDGQHASAAINPLKNKRGQWRLCLAFATFVAHLSKRDV